jgi:dopamine beta-monooxygenase
MYLFTPLFTFTLSLGVISSSMILVEAQQDPASYFTGDNNEAYITWLQQSSYEKSSFLPNKSGELGAAIHWTIDSNKIYLAVATKATGWAGFGFAESGSMLGADIVMFTVATEELVDSYVLDQPTFPFPDDCQSWTLINSVTEGGFIVFEVERLLDTGDTQDRVLVDDSNTLMVPTRVIAAWGNSVSPSYHGPDNNAKSSVRFFGSSGGVDEIQAFTKSMAAEAIGNFTIQANDFLIPPVDTHYQRFCVSAVDLAAEGVPIDQELHGIGIEPIIDPRTRKYVHHFTVSGMSDPWDTTQDCEDFPSFEMTYVWAPGDLPLTLPANVGGPLGANGGFRSFMLEIHYDNSALDVGNLDSSGIRVFYTDVKREFDMGVFETADVQLFNEGELVSPDGGGLSQHAFDCGGTCSAFFLKQPITVFREHFHMHTTGVSMSNAQSRNGDVIREGNVEFWDFNQQGNLAVPQEPFEILPGDGFRTTCNYNAKKGETWGIASSEEMCMAFLFYYPRQLRAVADPSFPGYTLELPFMCAPGFFGQLIPECGATYEYKNATDLKADNSSNIPAALGRTFGTAPKMGSCPLVTEIIDSKSPSTVPVAQQNDEPTNSPFVNSGAGNTESPDDSSAAGYSHAGSLAWPVLGSAMMGFLVALV